MKLFDYFLGLYCYLFLTPDRESAFFQFSTSVLRPIFQWLSLLSSSLNPLIYIAYSQKYRRAFHQLLLMPCRMRYQSLRRATRATLRLPPLKIDDRSTGETNQNSTEYDENLSSSKHYTSSGVMHGKYGRKVSLQHNQYYYNVNHNHSHKYSSESMNGPSYNRKLSDQSPPARRSSRQSLSVPPLTYLHSEKSLLNSNRNVQPYYNANTLSNGKSFVNKKNNNNNNKITTKKNSSKNKNVEIYVELNEDTHLLRSPLKVIKSYVWHHGRKTRGKINTNAKMSSMNDENVNNTNKKPRLLHSFSLKQQKMQNPSKSITLQPSRNLQPTSRYLDTSDIKENTNLNNVNNLNNNNDKIKAEITTIIENNLIDETNIVTESIQECSNFERLSPVVVRI